MMRSLTWRRSVRYLEVTLKRSMAFLAVAMLLIASHGQAANDRHVRVSLDSSGGSSVHGWVNLVQLPHGGTNTVVTVTGLEPGASYASFYYESSDCSAPADLLESFTASSNGTATIHGMIDDDLDEIGSVSIRVGPDYGTLLACADVHGSAK